MAEAHAKHHDYHLVDPSPWPLIGAISAFMMAVGAVMSMKGLTIGGLHLGPYVFGAGVHRRPLHHAELVDRRRPRGHLRGPPHPRGPAPPPLRHDHVHRLRGDVLRGVVLGLFRRRRSIPNDPIQYQRVEILGGTWPPKGIETFDPWHLPLLNTLILLTSGTTVTWAHHALLHNDRQGLKMGLWLTIILGVLFTRARPTSTATPPSASKATSTARPSSWRRASTART